jgi:hypothetical protein
MYGAITYYLAKRESVDSYLREGQAEFERMRDEARRENPRLYAKLRSARSTVKEP